MLFSRAGVRPCAAFSFSGCCFFIFQKDIICGIAEEAFAADTDMVVFSNIYNHWIRGEFLHDRFIIQVQHSKKVMTHKATRVIMGVTTQPQTGGAKCVITLILPQKSGSCQEF